MGNRYAAVLPRITVTVTGHCKLDRGSHADFPNSIELSPTSTQILSPATHQACMNIIRIGISQENRTGETAETGRKSNMRVIGCKRRSKGDG